MRAHAKSFALLLALGAAACSRGPAAAPPVEVVAQATGGGLPTDPLDPRWEQTSEYPAALVLQDMVEPRQLEPTTREVRVRALCDGARIAFRLAWDDASASDLPLPSQFGDACALQLPARTAPDVPAPQMGEPGRPVEIVLWRASWQATVNGRGDTIQDLHPNAAPDHYPFEAASLTPGSAAEREMRLRYAPARALGNPMAGPRERPVEDLVAEGPGTLAPAASSDATGRGQRHANGWAVVLARRVPAGLAPGARTQVAFAVWEGGHEEAGARKMRTGWIPLLLEVRP